MEQTESDDSEKELSNRKIKFSFNTELIEFFLTLKNVVKMCESVLTSRTKARKVEKPPFQTAGPIRVSVTLARAAIYIKKMMWIRQK